MPAILLHLTNVERLAADSRRLPPLVRSALNEDLAYARFGAALPDLPSYAGFRGGLTPFGVRKATAPFARELHDRAPVALGLKMAEVVSVGALVGREPGLAFVAGYFAHLCLDRVLHPVVDSLAARRREPGESHARARARIDWMHTLFFLRDLHGRDMAGNAYLRSRFQVTKRATSHTRGVGRGLYELIRISAHETLGQAPTKADVDSWVRGLFLYGTVLSSPIGRLRGLPAEPKGAYRALYQGPEVDVPAAISRAHALTREVLARLSSMTARAAFTPRSKARFLEEFPEGSASACAA